MPAGYEFTLRSQDGLPVFGVPAETDMSGYKVIVRWQGNPPVVLSLAGIDISNYKFVVRWQDGLPVVTTPPEIDMTNANHLLNVLMSVADRAPVIVVDMTATDFCDATGFHPLRKTGDHLRAGGGDLRVVCSPRLQRYMSKIHDDEHVSIFDTISEAMAATSAPAPVLSAA
jgi:anti-anti-sigma factor